MLRDPCGLQSDPVRRRRCRPPICSTVYQRALQNDPQIREADANRLASRESKPQALAALLPQIDASGSVFEDRRRRWRDHTHQLSDPTDENSPLVPVNITSDTDVATRDSTI